jgi:hypothetical protein
MNSVILTLREEFRCFAGNGGGMSSGIRLTGGILTGLFMTGDESLAAARDVEAESLIRTDELR